MLAEVSPTKLPSDECHKTVLMISQHWFRQWLGAVRQQAITWANVDPDLWSQMASLGLSQLMGRQMHNLSGLLTCSIQPNFAVSNLVMAVTYFRNYNGKHKSTNLWVPCSWKKSVKYQNGLTHCGLVMPYSISDLGQHCLMPLRCDVKQTNADLPVWYKTKFGSQNLATKFGKHLCMATKIGSQC